MAFNPDTAQLEATGFNPDTAQPAAPPAPRGYLASAASGVPEALWGTFAKGLSLAAAAPAMGVDAVRGMVTGKTETGAQDWIFKNLTDVATAKSQQYNLTAEEADNPGKAILHGLGGMLPTLVAAGATRGLIGGKELAAQTAAVLPGAAPWLLNAAQGASIMAPAAVATGASSAATKLEQGTDLATAAKTGMVDATGALIQGALPMSVTGKLATRVGSGAAINVATGEVQRAAQNAVLGANPELKREFTAQDAALNAATGALFAGILGPRPAKAQIATTKAEVQAELDPAAATPQARLPYNPLAGTPKVFPDGTVALGSEAELAHRFAPQPATPEPGVPGLTPSVTGSDITANLARDNPLVVAARDNTARNAQMAPTLAQAQAEIAATRARWGLDKPADTPAAVVETPAATAAGVSADLPLPPAMEAAMAPVVRARTQAEAQATRALAFEQAETAAAAQKDQQLAAIQNIAQGEQLAAAAALGETPANTTSLARPRADFMAATETLLAEAAAPKLKQDVAQAVNGKKTLADQVDALRQLQDGTKNKQSNRFEYLGRLIEQFTEVKAPDETALATQTPEAVAPVAQRAEPKPAEAVVGLPRDAADVPAKAADLAAPPAVDPVQGALTALKAAYGNDEAAMQAVRHIMDEANAAAPNGVADPAVMLQMAHDDAAAQTARAAEQTAADAAPRNKSLEPERQAVLDQVNTTRASLNSMADEYAARLQAREEMPEIEHERYARAAELQQSLARSTREGGRPLSNAFLADQAGLAADFATPEAWAKARSDWMAKKTTSPDELSHPLMALTEVTRPGNDILAHLETEGSTPEVRELAGKLRGFDLQTKVLGGGQLPEGMHPDTVAAYDPVTDSIIVKYPTESNTMHEFVHAATYETIKQTAALEAPRNQREAAQIKALDGLETLRKEALRRASKDEQYGLTNAHEFMAELNTNPGFQKFLADKGMWQRVVEGVRKLLGLPVESRNALEQAMDMQRDLFNTRAYDAAAAAKAEARQFDTTQAKAADVTDNVLAKVIQEAGEESRLMNFGRATAHAAMKKVLGLETKQYIVNRTDAVPEFRAVGLADAVRSMFQTDLSRRDANTYTQRAAAEFAGKLQAALHGITDPAARTKANDMAGRVAVGASIGGFDPWQNFKANLVDHPNLDPKAEAHINQTYRDFQTLQRAHPKLAEAIIEGAKANRHDYVSSTSVLVDGLLKHAAGSQTRLEAELNRMDPAQAALERARIGTAAAATPEAAFAQLYAGKLDFMAKDIHSAANTDTKRFSDGASAELHKRLSTVFAQAQLLPKDSVLRQQLGEMANAYGQQIGNAYYHAGRSGDYFVNVGFKNMDDATWAKMNGAMEGSGRALGDFTGQDHIFLKVDTAAQAEGLRRKLLAAGTDKIDMPRVRAGAWAEEGRLDSNAGISAAMRSVLDTLQDSIKEVGLDAAQAATMRDVVSRKFLSLLPETSVKTAKLHRSGVPGYDTDFLGTFAKHAAASTRDTANLYTMRAYTKAINDMTTGVGKLSESGDIDMQTRGQMVRDEMLKRYNNSMKTVDSGVINTINSLGHSFYLAMSPAFFIRSMAQPYHRGLPYLGSKYGFVSSAKEIGSATSVAMKIIGNSIRDGWSADGATGLMDASMKFDGLGLTPKEAAFMGEMQDRGVFDLGQARQLQRMAIDGSPRMQNATRIASMSAQYADTVNRIATGLAAFRLAEKASPSPDANTPKMAHMNYADQAVSFIMDDFSPDNTARAIGKHGMFGKVTPLATAFLNYNLQTMQQIARTVQDGMFSHDKSPEGLQRASEARKEFAGLMGTTSMIAGAMGLPFANVFAGVYNALFDDDNNPGDIRVDARNWLAENLGATIGEAVAHGPLQALTGVESSSFGMQNILPGSDFLSSRRLLQDRLDELPKTLMGPALNAGLDLAAGAIKLSDGQYVKGIGQMLPSGLKGYWKAGEIALHGHTDAKGNPIGLPATGWDVAVQATGLRPASRAETSEAAAHISARQERLNQRKSQINDSLFKASRFEGDMAGPMADVADFNRANPLQPIHDIGGSLRTRYMQEALGGVNGGVSVPTKKLLPEYQSQTRFNQRSGGMP